MCSYEYLCIVGVTEDEAVSHRLYDLEVIELSDNVNFIIVLPPSDCVCNVPGNQDMLSQKPDYISLPVKLFEMGKQMFISISHQTFKTLISELEQGFYGVNIQ